MEILRKIIDSKSLENSQGNFYGWVSFSKVCNFAIKRIHHRFFLGNIPKTNCFKKIKKVYSGPAS